MKTNFLLDSWNIRFFRLDVNAMIQFLTFPPTFLFVVLLASIPSRADELDQQIRSIFKGKCTVCHDDIKANAGDGIDYLLDFEKLTDESNNFFDKDDPSSSYLREVIEDGRMPRKKMGRIEWGGALSDDEKKKIFEWIDRGGAAVDESEPRTRSLLSERDAIRLIYEDLGNLTGLELENARYLTLHNLHNQRAISDELLELYRHGTVKMLNSLSYESTVCRPKTIGDAAILLRFDLRDIGWNSHDWDSVMRHYPYGLLFTDGEARSVYRATSSALPYVRADWFVFATSQPPLYHRLVKIPDTLQALEDRLNVKRLSNVLEGKVVRAGFQASGVSANNRLIERHNLNPGGAYWISYDFASNVGKQNLYERPLGPAKLGARHAFEHDGGEVIFNLPNGLQAYALVTAKGDVIDTAPNQIVYDNTMPGGTIINGISCISCHHRGMKPETDNQILQLDRIRENALQNFRRFGHRDRQIISKLFPDSKQLLRLMRNDRRRFDTALVDLGIPRTGPEPVRELFDRFVEDVDLKVAAASFGLEADDFRQQLVAAGERPLAIRLGREAISRDLYISEFRRLVRNLGIADPLAFRPLATPYFGSTLSPPPGQNVQQNLISEEHETGDFKVKLETVDGRNVYYEGEEVRFRVTTNRTALLTLVAVDATGTPTELITHGDSPNFRLPANVSTIVPTADMSLEIVVAPPHGRFSVKAIATLKPLEFAGGQSLATTKALVARPIGSKRRVSGPSIRNILPLDEWATDVVHISTHKEIK